MWHTQMSRVINGFDRFHPLWLTAPTKGSIAPLVLRHAKKPQHCRLTERSLELSALLTSLSSFHRYRRNQWTHCRHASVKVANLCISRLWEDLSPSESGPLEVTSELLKAAWESSGFRDPSAKPPLHRLAHIAFPLLFPTPSTAKKAIRRGYVLVDGKTMSSSSLSPTEGSVLTAFVDRNLIQSGRAVTIDQRLERWNSGKPASAQIRVLHHDPQAAWAVVNKPPGLHTSPVGIDAWQNLTLQSYLPAILEPPTQGTPCRNGPRPCHRLDMLVAGPVVVATSEEAMRSLNHTFRTRQVHKEYRAILCGFAGSVGDSFSVDMPLDGKESHTDVRILRVVHDDHYGALSEVSLKPLEGRRHQLRIHCACSGTPIVNDVSQIYSLAEQPWLKRHGTKLPQQIKRGQGLFLQAVKLVVPHPVDASPVKVEVDVAHKFQKLLDRCIVKKCDCSEQALQIQVFAGTSTYGLVWELGTPNFIAKSSFSLLKEPFGGVRPIFGYTHRFTFAVIVKSDGRSLVGASPATSEAHCKLRRQEGLGWLMSSKGSAGLPGGSFWTCATDCLSELLQ